MAKSYVAKLAFDVSTLINHFMIATPPKSHLSLSLSLFGPFMLFSNVQDKFSPYSFTSFMSLAYFVSVCHQNQTS